MNTTKVITMKIIRSASDCRLGRLAYGLIGTRAAHYGRVPVPPARLPSCEVLVAGARSSNTRRSSADNSIRYGLERGTAHSSAVAGQCFPSAAVLRAAAVAVSSSNSVLPRTSPLWNGHEGCPSASPGRVHPFAGVVDDSGDDLGGAFSERESCPKVEKVLPRVPRVHTL